MNQYALLPNEITVDLFAGGGGASTGIEQGLQRPVDIAVNHDPEAVSMHQANHPQTKHYCESVFAVACNEVTQNQPVGLLWASPDCTHHSKAKGGKPVSTKRRGLAWVVIRWARRCRPRVIMLENVEEFADWGPLGKDERPCKIRKGDTFRLWTKQLERCGYKVEHRILRACDYGAPTIRKRLFVIARRDGQPIVWPEASHAPADAPEVKRGRLQPYRSAAECIDWSIPCPSIFERKRPLAENTMKRIARGIQRFVLDEPQPFIIRADMHKSNASCVYPMKAPLRTITTTGGMALISPTIIAIDHGSAGAGPVWSPVDPVTTITTENRHALVTAFLAKHYGGNYTGPGVGLNDPAATVTTVDHHALIAAHMINLKGTDRRSGPLTAPAPTICAGGTHAGLVAAFLAPYYGRGSGETGRDARLPTPTITTKDRLQLVTVILEGEQYILADIGMRMLQPRELFRAQGFPDDYIINPVVGGRPLPKYAQVRMCGNRVPPVWPKALVIANMNPQAHRSAA